MPYLLINFNKNVRDSRIATIENTNVSFQNGEFTVWIGGYYRNVEIWNGNNKDKKVYKDDFITEEEFNKIIDSRLMNHKCPIADKSIILIIRNFFIDYLPMQMIWNMIIECKINFSNKLKLIKIEDINNFYAMENYDCNIAMFKFLVFRKKVADEETDPYKKNILEKLIDNIQKPITTEVKIVCCKDITNLSVLFKNYTVEIR